VVGGVEITGVHLGLSPSCPSLYSLPGVGLLRMAVMEALDGVMGATLLHHLVELQLALLPLVTCHHGVLLLQQVLVTILQAFLWVVHHHHLPQEEKDLLARAAVPHLLVDGECLHGEQRHPHLQPEVLLLVLYHHPQEVEVHHHPCHIGTREGGVGAKPTPCLTFSVPHHHHPHQAKRHENACSVDS